MENASRALIMAGGILIALMILGALMLLFNNLSSYQNQNDLTEEQAQLANFNKQYLAYDRDNLTLMDMKSLYNKIQSHNQRNPEETISSNVEDTVKNACEGAFKDIKRRL